MLITLCEPTSPLSSASPIFTWFIAPRGSVAELPEAIRPPTFDLMSIEERTGMEKTSGDLEGRTSRAQIDNRERIAHLAGSYSAANRIFQSELTRLIAAQKLHMSIIEKSTAVREAQSDVLCATARSKIYRRQGIAHLVCLVAAVDRVSQPLLPKVIPTQHLSCPLSSKAQLWDPPAATSTATRPTPKSTDARRSHIWLGADPRIEVSLRPSWPKLFQPQQKKKPKTNKTHEKK